MSNQPNTDRAEELRRLSDYELGQQREVCRGFARLAHDSRDAEAKARFAAEGKEIAAEWERRCAEREAREPEHMSPEDLARCVAAIDPEKFAEAQREIANGECIPLAQAKAGWREAQAAELERLRESLLPFVLYFEHAFDQARRPSLNLPDPVGDGLVVTQAEVARARDLLSKPQPQEASEVVGIDLARPGSDDRSAVVVRNPDGTVHVEFEEDKQ